VCIPGNEYQIFVIRIRFIPQQTLGTALIWRGEIEHLNTGRKMYVKNLEEIVMFIKLVVEEMGL
jgi:hypothetical protein